jgi:hypothetical protein
MVSLQHWTWFLTLSLPTSVSCILVLFFDLFPGKFSLTLMVPDENFVSTYNLPYACYISHPSYALLFNISGSIKWKVQIMNYRYVIFSDLSLRRLYRIQISQLHLFLVYSLFNVLPQANTQNCISIWKNRWNYNKNLYQTSLTCVLENSEFSWRNILITKL